MRRTAGIACVVALVSMGLSPQLSEGQELHIDWLREHSVPDFRPIYSEFLLDNSGDLIVLSSTGGVPSSATISRIDPRGSTVWETVLGTDPRDSVIGLRVAADPSGNLYSIASRLPPGASQFARPDFVVSKFSPGGQQVWVNTIALPSLGSFGSMTLDGNGNLYVTGSEEPSADAVLAKFDPLGHLAWARTFGSEQKRESGNNLIVDDLGNAYITYTSFSYGGSPQLSTYLKKFTSEGDTAWERIFDSAVNSEISSIAFGDDGDILVAGSANDPLEPRGKSSLRKFTPEGTENLTGNWPRALSGPSELFVDASGQIYVGGLAEPPPLPGVVSLTKSVVSLLDPLGALLWTYEFRRGDSSSLTQIAANDDGIYVRNRAINLNGSSALGILKLQTGVPEPSTGLLTGIAVVTVTRRSRTKQRQCNFI